MSTTAVAVTHLISNPSTPKEDSIHQDAAEIKTAASQSVPAAPAQPAKKLREFKDAAELKAAFDEINSEIQSHTSELVRGTAIFKMAWDAMLPHLDKMQSLLSQRGANKAERDAYAAMLRDAKLPGWMEYFDGLKLDVGLRAVQLQLEKYRRDKPRHLVAGQQLAHSEFGIGIVIYPMQTRGKFAVKFEEENEDKVIDENSANITAIDGVPVGKHKPEKAVSANKQLLILARRMVRLVLADGYNRSTEDLVKMLKADATKFRKLDVPKGEAAALEAGTQPAKVIKNEPATAQAAQPASPVQASFLRQSLLLSSKKYTVRHHPQGGSGIYEPGSTVCLERHPSQDAAWDAIEAVAAVPPSLAQIHG